MSDTGFMFFTFIFGGAMLFLAWMTVDNLKREFREDHSPSTIAPVSSRDTTNKENQ